MKLSGLAKEHQTIFAPLYYHYYYYSKDPFWEKLSINAQIVVKFPVCSVSAPIREG